jgi:hypothetical protein
VLFSASLSPFPGREAALFFERCCIECRKKAMEKKSLAAKTTQQAISLLKYPALSQQNRNLSSQSLTITESVGKSMKRRERMEKEARRELEEEKKQDKSRDEEVDFDASAASSNGCDAAACADSTAIKAVKIVGTTGAGFAVGLIGGPIGAVIGGVIGSGIAAASVAGGGKREGGSGERDEERRRRRRERRRLRKEKERRQEEAGAPQSLVRTTSLPKVQPTIVYVPPDRQPEPPASGAHSLLSQVPRTGPRGAGDGGAEEAARPAADLRSWRLLHCAREQLGFQDVCVQVVAAARRELAGHRRGGNSANPQEASGAVG